MKKKLSATLDNSAAYTLAVAAAMPETGYSFHPVKEVMPFGELLNHIAYGIQWWEANYIKGTKTEWAPPATGQSKAAVTAYLQQAYEGLRQTISSVEITDEAISGFFATLDHITHHRGQAVTYLRCNGITPPDYKY